MFPLPLVSPPPLFFSDKSPLQENAGKSRDTQGFLLKKKAAMPRRRPMQRIMLGTREPFALLALGHRGAQPPWHHLGVVTFGPYPQYGWHFPNEIPETFRKDPGNALRAGNPSRVRLGVPKPFTSRHLRLPKHFQNSLPPSTAFFRSGSGEGQSELVMEFPAVLMVFLNFHLKRKDCRNFWNQGTGNYLPPLPGEQTKKPFRGKLRGHPPPRQI